LSQWPMERPRAWINFVNESERESELEDLRSSAQRGRETLLKRLPTPFLHLFSTLTAENRLPTQADGAARSEFERSAP
jgi:hypothetical protein